MSSSEKWVTTSEVAAYLGKPESWIYARADSLGLPRVKIGRHFRFRLSEVDQWMGSQATSGNGGA